MIIAGYMSALSSRSTVLQALFALGWTKSGLAKASPVVFQPCRRQAFHGLRVLLRFKGELRLRKKIFRRVVNEGAEFFFRVVGIIANRQPPEIGELGREFFRQRTRGLFRVRASHGLAVSMQWKLNAKPQTRRAGKATL